MGQKVGVRIPPGVLLDVSTKVRRVDTAGCCAGGVQPWGLTSRVSTCTSRAASCAVTKSPLSKASWSLSPAC